MPSRSYNHRRVKTNRSYDVSDVAALFGVGKGTVREWIKRGLPTIDSRRPMLIQGRDLAAFLKARREKNKRPSGPGEIYCVRCRAPRNPAGNIADYQPATTTLGSLVGICPTCDAVIYRRVNAAKLDRVRGGLDVTMPKEWPQLVESTQPFVNHDFRPPSSSHANASRE